MSPGGISLFFASGRQPCERSGIHDKCASPEEVYAVYNEYVSKGAVGIAEPKVVAWGHTTGFFADPEGNIHSLFAVNPPNPLNPLEPVSG
ncbi:VOC family protein [Saccharibacillus brassicae]|uniref:VOC family protein n=1 Tax=Saccharibacillus brassicae TaxID=2583377 RepID=UPI00319DE4C6